MVDFILKQDYIYPVWTLTLDRDYIGLVNMESNNKDTYMVTNYTLDNKHFRVKLIDKSGKYLYKFSIPNPFVFVDECALGLAEVAKYELKKYRPWKSKILVDLRYLSIAPAN
jgi:hypothetical protein